MTGCTASHALQLRKITDIAVIGTAVTRIAADHKIKMTIITKQKLPIHYPMLTVFILTS